MKSQEQLQEELDRTNQKIIDIELNQYDDVESENLIGTMEFFQGKMKALHAIKDVLEWTLENTELNLNEWGREKYNLSRSKDRDLRG